MSTEYQHLVLTENAADKMEYKRMISLAVEKILASLDSGDAYKGLTPEKLRERVHTDELLPESGLGFDAVMEETAEKILPNFLRPFSTSYMAHLHSSALLESIVSELILSTFNQSMDSWDQAPVATEIEVEVIRHLCKLYGYGEGSDGVFTSGGSQSNLSGLLLARDWFCNTKLHWDVKKFGLPASYRKFRLYASEISHFSMEKSTHLMGLGYDCVVKVPVNDAMQMDVDILEKLIEEDLKDGNLPFCIAATVGTTDFGSIDPLDKLAEIAKKYSLWLHADAAYGSGVILSDKYAYRVKDLALCDSITVDFHKMFLLPISCSASLVKNGKNFECLTLHADYLNREEDEEDGYINLVDKSMQTTRRFDALKVWFSFRARGRKGWSQIITRFMENAVYLYGQLEKSPDFEVAVKPEISSVVFRVLPGAGAAESADDMNKRIRRKLLHEHGVVIGQTVCKGNVCLKFTLLNPLLTHEKLDELLALILSLR
ncbi:MAG: aspartate aminotransferase family protein [Lentisphaeria bacterium]|nr:aspartate aminotransferase family protein [Lentisphaeria bacterium]